MKALLVIFLYIVSPDGSVTQSERPLVHAMENEFQCESIKSQIPALLNNPRVQYMAHCITERDIKQ